MFLYLCVDCRRRRQMMASKKPVPVDDEEPRVDTVMLTPMGAFLDDMLYGNLFCRNTKISVRLTTAT